MKEAALYATLKAARIPLSEAVIQIIASGKHGDHASTRAVVADILRNLPSPPGPVPQLDDRARALNVWRYQLRGKMERGDAVMVLRAKFPMLDNFSSVMARNPPGTLVKRANELKLVESLDRLESENDDA